MADELRIPAEIVDKFSAPLKAFRAEMMSTGRHGVEHSDALSKGFSKVEGAIHGTARAASSALNPALAAVGITGLTAGAALAGMTAALNKVTSSLSGIGQLSRDTGIAAKTLQEFQIVAGRFNLSQEQVASGAQSFADKMRVFSLSQGELWQWVMKQGTNPASRKAFQDFAEDLARTSDEGEKLKKALAFTQTIKDPRSQRIFAEQFFGSGDFARLAQGQLGSVLELFEAARKKAGPFDQKAIRQAEDFDRAVRDLKGSMQTIGIVIAREVLPYVSGLAHWMDEAVKGERGPAIEAIRDALRGFGEELGKVDWKTAGADAKVALKAILDGVAPLAAELRKTLELIHAIKTGDVAGALRLSTGGAGTVGRILNHVAPSPDRSTPETEALDAMMRGQTMTPEQLREHQNLRAAGSRVSEIEVRQGEIHARLGQFGLLEKGGTASDRARQQADDLRRELQRLTEELKRIREGGAQLSKSSAEGDGLFGGARIQAAAFGGGRWPSVRYGGGYGGAGVFGGPGGGSGPGYVGEQGEAAPGGQGRPRLQGPIIAPDSEGGRKAQAFRSGVEGGRGGRMDRLGRSANVQAIVGELRAAGYGDNAIAAVVGSMQTESSFNPQARNNVSGGHTGLWQWDRNRWPKVAAWITARGGNPFDAAWQTKAWVAEHNARPGDSIYDTRRTQQGGAILRNDPSLEDAIHGVRESERFGRGEEGGRAAHARNWLPRIRSIRPGADAGTDPDFFPNGAPRILRPNSMGGAPGITMADADRLRATRDSLRRRPDILADANDERRRPDGSFYSEEEDRRAARDLGIALRARRAQEVERQERLRIDGDRINAAAARAGIVGGPQYGESNVSVVVNKAGPDATARVSTDGPVFKDAKIQSARPMRKAGD